MSKAIALQLSWPEQAALSENERRRFQRSGCALGRKRQFSLPFKPPYYSTELCAKTPPPLPEHLE
ncbi:MAG: hypothetical protein NTV43_15905 [Methylococcales bacterium]|nr:hypothetical protein [Methylococcales bacterium]